MSDPDYIPDAGDLIWTDFNPMTGREQGGHRPALVISTAVFTAATGFAVVCPITSRIRPFPTSVVLPDGLPVAGEVLISHVRSINTLARPIRFAGARIDPSLAADVRARLDAFVTI